MAKGVYCMKNTSMEDKPWHTYMKCGNCIHDAVCGKIFSEQDGLSKGEFLIYEKQLSQLGRDHATNINVMISILYTLNIVGSNGSKK